MRRHPWLIVSLVGLLAVLVLGSFPVRAYVGQSEQRRRLEAEAARLAAGNDVLLQQIERLKIDEVVEQLARDRYHLVKPGEEAYVILPGAAPDAGAHAGHAGRAGEPAATPTPAASAASKGGLLSRAWARVVSIF